jgi:hypothetical protein
MYYNSSGGACFFFDIDVKGGESVVNFKDATVVVISRMLQWYSCILFKMLPSMPKGEIVGMFLDKGRVCVFFIDGTCLPLMVKISMISSIVIMERSTV